MKIINSYLKFIKENLNATISGSTQSDISQNNSQPIADESSALSRKINKIVDYTQIKKGLLKENINQYVEEAINNNCYGICVNPEFVDYTVYDNEDNKLKVISTLDFPDGKLSINDKMTELMKVISDGVDEIDMCIDIEEFKNAYVNEVDELKIKEFLKIESDVKKVSDECHKNGIVLKVVIEISMLSFDELTQLCNILTSANADYIQTASGTKGAGNDLDKIKEIRRCLHDHMKIKASGGIRTLEEANKLYPYVDRIGTSVILK